MKDAAFTAGSKRALRNPVPPSTRSQRFSGIEEITSWQSGIDFLTCEYRGLESLYHFPRRNRLEAGFGSRRGPALPWAGAATATGGSDSLGASAHRGATPARARRFRTAFTCSSRASQDLSWRAESLEREASGSSFYPLSKVSRGIMRRSSCPRAS